MSISDLSHTFEIALVQTNGDSTMAVQTKQNGGSSTGSRYDISMSLNSTAKAADYYALEIVELIGHYTSVEKIRSNLREDSVRITFDGQASAELDTLREHGYTVERVCGEPTKWYTTVIVSK